ncbi:MAG: glycosyltransferase family 39 protein [Myxococcota bacterium]|nr:glycosyltransferase family 39 protein [Myxococcota bacterium]
MRASDKCIALGLVGLAGFLLLTRLDQPLLWQDEAQTALLARSIFEFGVPVGFDAVNSYSQELGVEYGPDGRWRWHPWLPFYLVAASFATLGTDTASARIPFALCGLATVLLAWAAGRDLFRDRFGAAAGALLLCVSLSFVVLSRQARYYALAALLSLVGLWIGAHLRAGKTKPTLALVATATLLFYTQAVYAASLLLAILLHAAWLHRAALRPALLAAIATGSLAAPWIAWVGTTSDAAGMARFLAWRDTPLQLVHYGNMLFDPVFASGALLVAPLALFLLRVGRGTPVLEAPAPRHAALLALYVAVTILLLGLLSPLPYLRYLAPILPPIFLLVGMSLGALYRAHRALAVFCLAVALVFGSLDELADEYRDRPPGPIAGIVSFLGNQAAPGDRVAIAYGDLPVKFYTGLRTIGGLSGEPLDEVAEARWLIPRRHAPAARSREVNRALRRALHGGTFRRHVLPVPDRAFENREDPRLRSRRAAADGPRVVIWERTEVTTP